MNTQYRDAVIYGALLVVWGIAGLANDRASRRRALKTWRRDIAPRFRFAQSRRDAMITEEFDTDG